MLKIEPIKSDARAVMQLSEHVLDFKERINPFKQDVQRGGLDYITPTQEDFLMHGLISYWKSRLALLEIIQSMRKRLNLKDIEDEENMMAFLVGYSATILLADIAKFLYESYENWPLGRDKLNQSLPTFEIPAGSYDTIQESLINLLNVQRMESANHFYKTIKPNILKIEYKHPWISPIVKIISDNENKIELGLIEFAKKSLKTQRRILTQKVARQPIDYAVYNILEGASRLISNIKTSFHQPNIPTNIRQDIESYLQAGDILITRKSNAMTNYFLPGYWPHASLYLGNEKQMKQLKLPENELLKSKWALIRGLDRKNSQRVLEALKDGVRIRAMQSVYNNDSMAIIRPLLKTEDIEIALNRAMSHEGKPYDFNYDFNRSDRLVCTEVIYRTYEGIGNIHIDLATRVGRKNLSAEDLLRMSLENKYFKLVGVYCPEKNDSFCQNLKAKKIIKETVKQL